MRFRILGPLEAEGRAVDVGGPKPRTLLTALLLERGAVVPVDRLAAEWRERPNGG